MKTASEITYTVSSGVLNSTPTNLQTRTSKHRPSCRSTSSMLYAPHSEEGKKRAKVGKGWGGDRKDEVREDG